jgi:hypothetical protein
VVTVPRKKKTDSAGGLGVLAFQLLGAILILSSFLAILVLVVAWLYFEWAIKKYHGVKGRGDFKLPASDLKILQDYTQAKERIENRIAEIAKFRKSLPLRADGSFDNRNNEGKSLNLELQTLRADLEQCDRIIDDLTQQEEVHFKRWVTVKSGLFSSRTAMLSVPAVALLLYIKTPAMVLSLSRFIEQQTGMAAIPGIDDFYGIFVATTGVVTLAFLALWGVSRSLALRSSTP